MQIFQDHTYSLHSPEDTFSKLNGGKVFSKRALSDAYLQVKVDEECSKVLAIKTFKGLYKLNRVSFGLMVALNLFQQVMDTMLVGQEFAIAYLDDTLLRNENKEQHKNISR